MGIGQDLRRLVLVVVLAGGRSGTNGRTTQAADHGASHRVARGRADQGTTAGTDRAASQRAIYRPLAAGRRYHRKGTDDGKVLDADHESLLVNRWR
jgi:hypothetical protein